MSTSVVHDCDAYGYLDSEEPFAVHLQLSWTAEAPFTVTLVFPGRTGTPLWVFSRELLEQGLYEPAGLGDVRCAVVGNTYTITLVGVVNGHQPAATLDLDLTLTSVTDFLAETQTVVPYGAESHWVDLDSKLAQLLNDAA